MRQQTSTGDADQYRSDRALARDPAANPVELRKLANIATTDRKTREALASNPATPPEVLLDLMETAAPSFCRNPIAPLLTLETPDFMTQASELGIGRMLRSERAPATLVHYVADDYGMHEYLRKTARQHVAYAAPIAEEAWREEVRKFLRRAINDSEKQLFVQEAAEAVELAGLPASLVSHLNVGPTPSLQTLDELAATLTPVRRAGLLAGWANPEKVCPIQAGDSAWTRTKEHDLYACVGASFRSDPIQAVFIWAEHHTEVAEAIARNPKASPFLLATVVKNLDVQIRRTIITNPASTPEVLRKHQQATFGKILHQPAHYLKQRRPGYYGGYHFPWVFGRLVALMYGPDVVSRPLFRSFTRSPLWEERLTAALAIRERGNDSPMPGKHRVLLEQLARDGHVLVRAVGQARLRGETFSLSDV